MSHVRHVPIEPRILPQHLRHYGAVLQPDVRLHVVPPGERLSAQRTEIRLGPVDGGVMPTVANGFAADPARVQTGRLRYFVEQIAIVLRGGRVKHAATAAEMEGRRFLAELVMMVMVGGWVVAGSLFPPNSWNRESQPSPSSTRNRGGGNIFI